MSDEFVRSFFTFAGVVFTGAMAYATVKLKKIDKTADKVHILVNSSMSLQLKDKMTALKRVAELTKKESDIAEAAEAEKLWQEHEARQAIVDSNEKL